MRYSKKSIAAGVAGFVLILTVLTLLAPTSSGGGIFFHVLKDSGISFWSDSSARTLDTTKISVYHTDEQKLVEEGLDDYLIGVVAAEMPADFEPEALKAQAVAARTFVVRRAFQGSGCSEHAGADICTSSAHCQAYSTLEQMKEKWGDLFEKYYNKIKKAVEETTREILTYNGEPIDAIYHSNSGGQTEDVEHVYANALPYLKSVSSPGEENFGKYEGSVSVSYEDFVQKVREKREITLNENNLSAEVSILSRYDSGRVNEIRVGDATFTGKEFRTMFGLNSTNFTIDFGEEIVFHTLGYGHGVGMSQSGANAMALAGSDYQEILHHYYTDVTLEPYQT